MTYLAGLSRRERALLGLMTFAALPLAAVWLLALPLAESREAARRAAAEARALDLWVADQAVQYARFEAAPQAAVPAAAPIGISGIERSLLTAGLRGDVAELANTVDGGITLRFEAVRFTVLMDWLAASAETWGYDLAGFRVERGERADVVAAEFRLVVPQ